MKFSVAKELFAILPNAKIAGLFVTNLVKKADFEADQLDALKYNCVQALIKKASRLENSAEITRWDSILTSLGMNTKEVLPSHCALVKRVVKDKKLPQINPIVDIYNCLSIRHLIPIGGHRVDNITHVEVTKTTEGFQFQPMNSEQAEIVNPGEWVYSDGKSHVLTRRLVWRQGETSKINTELGSIFFPIDDLVNTKSAEQLEKIAQELITFLSLAYDFSYDFGICSKYNHELTFENLQSQSQAVSDHYLLKSVKVNNSPEAVAKFFDRKLDLIYPSQEELKQALLSGDRLKFYIGADATAPNLHIGHLLPVLKLRELQRLGHQIIFLIGDFTARIGDPTDKSATRVKLNAEEVAQNAQSFKAQIGKYIDFNATDNPALMVFNSDWNAKLDFGDVLELASNFTVQQMLERDMFAKRMQENKPIFLHEFLYPLLQGYDSVYLEVDGEFGGRDQTFNMLAGRTLEKNYLGINKFVVTTHFLLSADGVNKMSKSIGNCIFLNETPENKYGKIMSIPDSLIIHYYEMATSLSDQEISAIKQQLEDGANPMALKKQLAFRMLTELEGEQAAQKAEQHFEMTVQNQEVPDDIPVLAKSELKKMHGANIINIKDLLVLSKLAPSGAEAKRLVAANAVDINGEKVNEPAQELDLDNSEDLLVKAGKRKWLKLT